MARIISNRFLMLIPRQSQVSLSSLLINHRHQARAFSGKASGGDREEDIVIVGGGIAGLATALSLHRVGIKSRVLEQANELRTSGVCISLSKNAWSALDSMGVGDELRRQYYRIQGILLTTDEGKELGSFEFNQDDKSQELRAVERKALLLTLANHLPPESIQFGSNLSKIEQLATDRVLLRLTDGSQITAKIVVGCDGIRSKVAKWMGFGDPKYSGHHCFRGLGVYPEGHSLKPLVKYMYGKGIRGGYLPASPTKVYWFLCYNNPNPGLDTIVPSELKHKAQTLVKESWRRSPEDLLEIINQTPDDVVACNPLEDRWPWPGISPAPIKGRVVLTGDAWHPMTPNLGQGACCALEDAVVLSEKIQRYKIGGEGGGIEEVMRDYVKERRKRVFPVTVQSNLVGKLLQSESGVVCGFRNVVVPKLMGAGLKAALEVGLAKEKKS